MSQKSTFERLNDLFAHFKRLGHTQNSFASILGITQAQLSRLLKGKSGITRQHELLLEKALGVNIVWLNTGLGKMFLPEQEIKRLDAPSLEILANYEKLGLEYRSVLHMVSISLVEAQEKAKKEKAKLDIAAEPTPKYPRKKSIKNKKKPE